MKCPVCAKDSFNQTKVLKERLIGEWDLSAEEVDYINIQQGFYCQNCLSNLRSMALAENILSYYLYEGPLIDFAYSQSGRSIKLLEINEAGGLHNVLEKFRNFTFAKYPDVDIQNLPYKDESFDVIIHSDTLEHIENRYLALQECYRVTKIGGVLFYTIPIINGRMTRCRKGLQDSFHGKQDESQGEDYKVWTEYGSDFWVELFKVGYKEIRLITLTDQSTISICARKLPQKTYPTNKLIQIVKLFSLIIKKIKAI